MINKFSPEIQKEIEGVIKKPPIMERSI